MKLLKSFRYAISGLIFCIKSERNFRIHMVAAVTLAIFSYFYRVSEHQVAFLVFTVIFVFVTEMINTAIEKIVDLASPDFHEYAKIAKDVAAGAVFVAALSSIIIATGVFNNIEKLFNVLKILMSSWVSIAAVVFYVVICFVFVFKAEKKGEFFK